MAPPRLSDRTIGATSPLLRRTAVLPLLLTVLFVLSSGIVPFVAVGGIVATPQGHALTVVPTHPPVIARSGALPPVHPLVSQNISPLFFNNTWSVGNASASNTSCNVYCYPMSQNPTLVNLSNGDLGLGFSAITNYSSVPSTCSAGVTVVSRIGWSTSSDGGQTWAPLRYIGNNGTLACQWFDGMEPSFAVSSTGEIFAAFVAANATLTEMYTSSVCCSSPRPVVNYLYRPSSSIAVISSTDNGATWSSMQLVVSAGGNFSNPRLAVYGDSIYIAYTTLSNSTGTIPGALSDASAVRFVYSTDDGSSWHGPVTLPGNLPFSDPTQDDNTMAASVAVSPTGEVGVVYAANRTCAVFCALGFGTVYSDDIVLATSSNNGSSWSSPMMIARGVTEFSDNNYGFQGQAVSEGILDTSFVWGTATHLYVAWSQSQNMSLSDQYAQQLDYWAGGIFTAASTNAGSSWTTASVTGPAPGLDYNQQVFGFGYFNPVVALNGGTVYLAFSHYNWTNGGSGYNAYASNVFGLGNAEWMTSSPDGVSWQAPMLVINDPQGSGITDFVYWGTLGSIAFDRNGSPVIAYALQTAFLTYVTNFNCPIALMVAIVYHGPTTVATIAETGLAPGTTWEAQISGQTIRTIQPEFNITDAPVGRAFYVDWPGAPTFVGYRAAIQPVISQAPLFTASAGATDWFNFTVFYGIEWFVNPGNVPSFNIQSANFNSNDGYDFYWYWATQLSPFGTFFYQQGTPMPWYFPAGTWLNFSSGYCCNNYYYGNSFIGYWSGTGLGAFNGASASPSIHLLSPINETAWMAAYGLYNESFQAPGLPSSSTYSFSVDGLPYSGSGGSTVVVPNLGTGAHEVTNITATSSRAGWAYFGFADSGNPLVVPNIPSVNLSFALVDLGSSPGTVSYKAVGLPTGSPWQLSFNGTEYSSTTPWINVTTRSGDFPVTAYPAVSGNSNQTFVPSGVGSGGSVTVGQAYDVNFTSTYELQLIQGAGGRLNVTPGRYFLGPGSSVSVSATPSPGFSFGGWTGSGPGSYSGPNLNITVVASGPITESAAFVPLISNRFNVTINETGLPAGTLWGAIVGGVGYSTTSSSLVIPNENSCTFSGSAGRYAIAVPYVHANGSGIRYVPLTPPITVCGGGAPVLVNFGTQYSLSVTAATGGAVTVTAPSSPESNSPYWVPSGDSVTISAAANAGYTFLGWVGTGPQSYTGSLTQESVTVSGATSEIAEFAPISTPPPARYTATITELTALAAGTAWTISNSTASFSSTNNRIAISGLLTGSYSYSVATVLSPDGLVQYTPTARSITVSTVAGNTTGTVQFVIADWVTLSAVGPGSATIAAGGAASSTAGRWVANATTIALAATAQPGALFLGWTGAGAGAYTGSSANHSVTVTGPVSEIATFALAPPPATAPTSSTSPWSSPLVWAGLAAVGLVIGLAIGLMMMRSRRPPTAAAPETPPEAGSDEPAPEAPTEEGTA